MIASPVTDEPPIHANSSQGHLVERVRAGRTDQTLFLVPASDAEVQRLTGLVAALRGPQAAYLLAPPPRPPTQKGSGVGRAAQSIVDAIRTVQPTGPYHMVSLSSGATLALAAARALRARGAEVAAVFVVELASRQPSWSRRWFRRGAASEYDGAITVISAIARGSRLRDQAQRWAGGAGHVLIRRIDGAASADFDERVAQVIDHQLARRRKDWPGLTPRPGFERPMLLTTMRWFGAARVAHALIEAGFAVSACRPGHHPLDVVDGLTGDYRLRRTAALRSLAAAIRRAKPDIILPEDERSLEILRRLYDRMSGRDEQTAAVIARSLGHPDQWPVIASRTGLAREASMLGVVAPATAVVRTLSDVRSWVREHGLPMVLKTDGSWGGRGVVVIHDEADLEAAWRRISDPPSMVRALKRLVVNREVGPLLSRFAKGTPTVNAQAYVAGRDAIATASCLDGDVLQIVCLEVVHAAEERGASTVVRIIDHPQMAESVRALAGRLGLSGFCGFDFVIDGDGRAVVIELNPRLTPTCFLVVEGDHHRHRTVALFPFELVRRGAGAAVTDDFDLPVRAPRLIERGLRIASRERRTVAARRLARNALGWLAR